MTPLFRRALAALVTAMLVLPAAPALAQEPVAWERVDVVLHADSDGAIYLVSGQLPETAKLPAEVELAVPTGSEFLWAGEILGGPPTSDPEVTYTVSQREGMDVYSFTLSKSRTAQIEVDAGQAAAFDGTNYSTQIGWTAPWPVALASLSARIPQGAQIVSPADGASVKPGPQGFSYYIKDFTDLEAGQEASLAFTYSAPAGAASGGSATGSASSDGGVATAIAIVVMLGALALVGFAVWRKMERSKQAQSASAESSKGSSASKPSSGKRAETSQPAAAKQRASGGPKKSTIMIAAVVVVLVVGVIIAATSGGSATVVGDTVTMTYATVDECAVANIPLTPPSGANLADDAEDLLQALRTLEGVGKAAINLSTNTMTVDYCQSYADETRIRELLAPTGYVQNVTAIPPAPATESTTTP